MIAISRIDHISLIVDEIEPVVNLFESLLGFRVGSSFERSGYIGIDMEIPGTKAISVEVLMSKKNDNSNLALSISKKAAIHHIGLQVESLSSAVDSINDLYLQTLNVDNVNQFAPFELKPRVDNEGRYVHIFPGWQVGSGFYYEIFDGQSLHLPNYFLNNSTQGIGIKKLNAWAHVSNNDITLSDWYERLFGMETIYYWNPSPVEHSFSIQTLKFSMNEMNVEILKPLKINSYMQNFLDQFGNCIHHISFEIENMDFVSQLCSQFGIEIFGLHSGVGENGKWYECFIEPPQIRGLLIHFFSWEI